jgi:CSLREA domain-containing protein
MAPRLLGRSLLCVFVFTACGEEGEVTAPRFENMASHHAGHLVVNSLADPGDGTCDAAECTLREAIAVANQDPDPSEISFAPKVTGAITLDGASGQLTITEDLSISGPKGGMVIQRNSADAAFRIFDINIDPGMGSVVFTRLTIRGGQATTSGGAIRNAENLTLSDCTVSSSTAPRGGGILTGGELTLRNSAVLRNSATHSGGGIADFGGTVTLINSTVADNRVTGTTGFGGGGIHNQGQLTILGSTISGNSSAVAGGGISNVPELAGEVRATLTNSTVSGNSAATLGGGVHTSIFNAGSGQNVFLSLINSTVVGNSAGSQGGGLNDDATVLGTFTALTNSIVALNAAPSAPDVFGNFCEGSVLCGARFNMVGVGAGATDLSDGVHGNKVGTSSSPLDPKLGPLASNGGATQTHALKPGSPAINAASTAEGPTIDQRGLLRPQGAASDIGSYERKSN